MRRRCAVKSIAKAARVAASLIIRVMSENLASFQLSLRYLQSACQTRSSADNHGWRGFGDGPRSENHMRAEDQSHTVLPQCNTARCQNTSVSREAQRPLLRTIRAARGLCCVALLVAIGINAPIAAAGESDPPGPDAAMQAYQQLASVQSAWSQDAAKKLIDPPRTTGVCLTLRENGKVIGRAEVMADDGNALRQAMLQVIEQAPAPHVIEGVGVVPRMIDLQFAGPLFPLAGDTFAAAAALVSPGREGVAARIGNRVGSAFPSVILATDSTSNRALRVACARAEGPPMELRELRKQFDVHIYRFEVTHLAMPDAHSAPIFLTRGGQLIEEASVKTTSIRSFADDAAAYLLQSLWPGEEPFGMMGPYRAARDEYEPFIAEPHAQALAALALARYARTPGVNTELAIAAQRTAWDLLFDFTVTHPPELDPMGNIAALGMWLAAWAEAQQSDIPIGVAIEEMNTFAARAAQVCADSLHGPAPADEAARITRALIALGLATSADEMLDPAVQRAIAQSEVHRLFTETHPGQLVALMPWLGWAALELIDPEKDVPAAAGLELMRGLVWKHQVLAADAGSERDLIGGIVFTRGRQPLPTWHSAKPLALLATMLGDPRFTSPERVATELPNMARGLRFLMQLSAGNAEGHMYPKPERAQGGVRRALWDQTITADATALGLLTACETLRSVDAIGAQR